MAIPNVEAEKIREAMHSFDQGMRDTEEWKNWEQRKTFVYGVDYEGSLYPAKKIISLAAGIALSDFDGGNETNNYLRERGFNVRELREDSLGALLSLILERYAIARSSQAFRGRHEIWEYFDRVRRILKTQCAAKFPHVKVVTSYGNGNWAEIPWVAFLDDRETNTTQAGTYVVYLFRENGDGVYITLAQGVTVAEKETGTKVVDALKAEAEKIRSSLPTHVSSAFGDTPIELGGHGRYSRLYAASTAAAKLYRQSSMPNDAELASDLDTLLEAYDAFISANKGARKVDSRKIALVGTARKIAQDAPAINEAISATGAWASPWSFGIKSAVQGRLVPPFHLFLNGGGGTIVARARVVDMAVSSGSQGMISPWPDVTRDDWKGKQRSSDLHKDVNRTWFKISALELVKPFDIRELELVTDLSTPENVLNQSSFGYVYDPIDADVALSQVSKSVAITETSQPKDFDWLVRETLLAEPILRDMIGALTGRSPQILLAGPPGTSKSWVAQKVAQYIVAGRTEAVRLVQFHPSYTYESFVEGLRPVSGPAGVVFERTPGAVLEMTALMSRNGHMDDLNHPYVLILDEANRANLPRVLGELLFLFEYRGEAIKLQYSDNFRLPKNLYFVATMNTADRSIRAIDAALRRRFDVFELAPDGDVLDRYFRARATDSPEIIAGFRALNAALSAQLDRHHTIGHSFFMSPDMTAEDMIAIWSRRIYPLIEEFFFDQPDLAREFTLERFWPRHAS